MRWNRFSLPRKTPGSGISNIVVKTTYAPMADLQAAVLLPVCWQRQRANLG